MKVDLIVTEEDLHDHIGRLLKIVTTQEEDIQPRVGFLSSIRNGRLILDDTEPVSLVHVKAVYNIVSKKIAGEGPEVFLLD